MQAIKENRVYTITDVEMDAFQKEGYDIYDGEKLVAYGFGKTVPYEKYAQLEAQVEKLQKEIADLKSKKKGAK